MTKDSDQKCDADSFCSLHFDQIKVLSFSLCPCANFSKDSQFEGAFFLQKHKKRGSRGVEWVYWLCADTPSSLAHASTWKHECVTDSFFKKEKKKISHCNHGDLLPLRAATPCLHIHTVTTALCSRSQDHQPSGWVCPSTSQRPLLWVAAFL